VTDLVSALDKLLQINFCKHLATAVEPYARRAGGLPAGSPAQLVVADVNTLMRDVADTFKARHVLAHEAAPRYTISKNDALRMVHAVQLLIDGIEAVLWATANADQPLTQAEMTQAAEEDAARARDEVERAFLQALAATNEGTEPWLQESQRAWEEHAQDWVLRGYLGQMGTFWPAVAAQVGAALARERAQHLKEWTQWQAMEGDEDGEPEAF
jgi:uncharacterized protein YecT (DUF1311 family)